MTTHKGAALSSVVVGSAAVGLIRASRKRGRYGTQIAEGALTHMTSSVKNNNKRTKRQLSKSVFDTRVGLRNVNPF